MANEPASSKRTQSTAATNGKNAKGQARAGAYDPKPGAAVKGRAGDATAPPEHLPRRHERRPELIKKRREELRRMPEKKKKEQLYTRVGLGALAVILVVAIGYTVYAWAEDRDLNQAPDGVITLNYSGGTHDDAFNAWPEVPPAGGTHNNTWQTCQFYDGYIETGMGVHSQEHGAVWITYRPDLPQDQIDELKKIAGDKNYVLVSKFDNLPSPIVASSWNHQLQVQSAFDKALDQYIRVYMQNREFTPEPGASCTGVDDIVAP